MYKELSKYENTFKEFTKFLYIEIYKKNDSYKKFFKQNESFISDVLIRFLEYKNVPVIEAINYYGFNIEGTFAFKVKLCIVKEFYRMEYNKRCSYIPF